MTSMLQWSRFPKEAEGIRNMFMGIGQSALLQWSRFPKEAEGRRELDLLG